MSESIKLDINSKVEKIPRKPQLTNQFDNSNMMN